MPTEKAIKENIRTISTMNIPASLERAEWRKLVVKWANQIIDLARK